MTDGWRSDEKLEEHGVYCLAGEDPADGKGRESKATSEGDERCGRLIVWW